MRKIIKIVIVVVAVAVLWWLWSGSTHSPEVADSSKTDNDIVDTVSRETKPVEPTVVAENLEIPWDIVFLPDQSILVAERVGRVTHLASGKIFPITGAVHTGEGGLLGMTLHPDFVKNHYLYLFQTTSADGALSNQVVRYVYENNKLIFNKLILTNIPGARYHDGGRIEFGPDNKLYITVGDATNEKSAQDQSTLAGSILRLNDDGSIPADNPFGNAIYSYGHRNPQGLAWDELGNLWSTEHGRSGVLSGLDEVNLIVAGGNYGWPESQGDTVRSGTVAPSAHSGASKTWAPASALYWDGSIFFGGLRGVALYEAVLRGTEIIEIKEHLKNKFGRIRTVRLGPDGAFYLTTSNRDGRGQATAQDDRIIRLDPAQFR